MNTIIEFIRHIIALEQEARNFDQYRDKIGDYNTVVQKIQGYMIDETVGLGLPLTTRPKPDFWYDRNTYYPKPRHLYKITQYNNKEHGTLWACYVSVANPIADTVKSIANCLIVAEIEGELKFISKFIYDDDDLVWKHVGGIDLNFHELGTVQQVERLLSPENDEWSMEEYLLDR